MTRLELFLVRRLTEKREAEEEDEEKEMLAFAGEEREPFLLLIRVLLPLLGYRQGKNPEL